MPDGWIREWGDPVLRHVARPIADVDDLLRAQARRMVEHLLAVDGAGLAATQVGFLRRVFVFRASRDAPVEALVNPRVVERSGELATFEEGCLSFPAVTVAVQRPVAVRVEAIGIDGEPRAIEAEGDLASLLQHETDHLDGILTLDRAEPEERRRALSVLLGRSELAA